MRQEEPAIVQPVKGRNNMKHTKRIGLTGIMGAGKSSVIKLLTQYHIPVLDCDEINRTLIRKGERGYLKIIEVFGSALCDEAGNLDAQKMSDRIFSHPQEKQALENILHPMIKEEIEHYCQSCESELLVVEVPLLFEVHWETYFDEAWVVVCKQDILLDRLEKYRHIPKAEAIRRLAHQMSQEEKCRRADVVLYNDYDLAYLKAQIDKEIQRIKKEGLNAT